MRSPLILLAPATSFAGAHFESRVADIHFLRAADRQTNVLAWYQRADFRRKEKCQHFWGGRTAPIDWTADKKEIHFHWQGQVEGFSAAVGREYWPTGSGSRCLAGLNGGT